MRLLFMARTVDGMAMDMMRGEIRQDPTFSERWITRGLKSRYDPVLREPLAPELAALLREIGARTLLAKAESL